MWDWEYCDARIILHNQSNARWKWIVFAIAGLYAEQNILIFKVLASFLAGILKLMHHMVNLSNESGQAWLGLIVLRYYYHVFIWTP